MPHPEIGISPPDKEIYARIGMVASEWAYIEMLLDKMLAHFISAPPGTTYVITQTVGSASIVQWIRTLIDVRLRTRPENFAILTDLLNEVDGARSERNTIVHGVWRAGDVEGAAIVQTFRWDRAEVIRDEVLSPPDLDDFIEELQQIQKRLKDAGVSLGFLP